MNNQNNTKSGENMIEDEMDDLLAALNSEHYNPPIVHQTILKKRVADKSHSEPNIEKNQSKYQ